MIRVADPAGRTGEITLLVEVTDAQGVETIESLTVVQEFNFQIADHADGIIERSGLEPESVEDLESGLTAVSFTDPRFDFVFGADKEINEYISTNPLSPIEITEIVPGAYEVTFFTEWPGRFPLLLTATDSDGNTTTARVPVEVHWDEQPYSEKGVALATGDWAQRSALDSMPHLIDLAEDMNMNYVLLSPHWILDGLESPGVVRCEEIPNGESFSVTPTDEQLITWIEYAHDKGIAVMLAPHLACLDWCNSFDIAPPSWPEWFDSYSDLIFRLADLAEASGVERFSIGDELRVDSFLTTEWRAVVAGVRERYGGLVTYMDFMYWSGGEGPQFEDALDFLGANFFPPGAAADVLDPMLPEMDEFLTHHMDRVLPPKIERAGKPAMVTSLGRSPHDGTAFDPWNANDSPPDYQEQVDWYEAAFRYVARRGLTGIMVWSMDATPDVDVSPMNFDIRNKPVMDMIRIWFSGSADT